MKTTRNFPILAATAIAASLGHGAPAIAADPLPFEAELEACVNEVTSHIDLSDATRVRHTIVRQSQNSIGYELRIDSAVYADDAERRYKAHCVARGGKPVTFRISEENA